MLEKLKTWFGSEPPVPVVASDVAFKRQGDQHLNQGKFDVTRQTDFGLATVRNPFHGSAKRDDPRAVVKRALGQANLLTLAELKRRVRRAAE